MRTLQELLHLHTQTPGRVGSDDKLPYALSTQIGISSL